MGRNKGTNSYSNNYEPHVAGVLDARTHITGGADNLTKSETWISDDGNIWIREGIRVSVTQDTDSTKNGIYLLLDDDYTQANNWLFIGSNSGGSTDSKVYVTTINFGNFIDDQSVTPTIQAEFENIINKWKQGYVVLYHSDNLYDSNTYGVLLTERNEANGWYTFYITCDDIKYSIVWNEGDSDVSLREETEFYRINLVFSTITNNKEYTLGEKAEVSRIINNAKNNKKIYFKTTYNSISSSIMSGVVNVSYNGNEEITFSVVQPNGDIKYYSPNGANSGTYWKVWTVKGKQSVFTLSTPGLLDVDRVSNLDLTETDVATISSFLNSSAYTKESTLTYCDSNEIKTNNEIQKIPLNVIIHISASPYNTGTITASCLSPDGNYVYKFLINFIYENGSVTQCKASAITSNPLVSKFNINSLSTPNLFSETRTDPINIYPIDNNVILSLFAGKFVYTPLLYTGVVISEVGTYPLSYSGQCINTQSSPKDGDEISLSALGTNGVIVKVLLTYSEANSSFIADAPIVISGGDSKVYQTTLNLSTVNGEITDTELQELNNIISKFKAGYVILANYYNEYDQCDQIIPLTIKYIESENYLFFSFLDINGNIFDYNAYIAERQWYLYNYPYQKYEKCYLPFYSIKDGSTYTAAHKEQVLKCINKAKGNSLISYDYAGTAVGAIYSGVLDISYDGNETASFRIPQADGSVNVYSPTGVNSGTTWKVKNIPVESSGGGDGNIKYLTTPGLFSATRGSEINLNASDCSIINSLFNNNYKNIQLYYMGAPTGTDGIFPVNVSGVNLEGTSGDGNMIYLSITNDLGVPLFEYVMIDSTTVMRTIQRTAEINSNITFNSSSLNQNGYTKFNNGLLIQWGYFSGGVSNGQSISFPLSFKSCFSLAFSSTTNNTNNSIWSVNYAAIYASYFTVYRRYVDAADVSPSSQSFRWIAIGDWK